MDPGHLCIMFIVVFFEQLSKEQISDLQHSFYISAQNMHNDFGQVVHYIVLATLIIEHSCVHLASATVLWHWFFLLCLESHMYVPTYL